jgi:hypothetical protein
MILPKERDSRFITIRRGGTLTDKEHYLLAVWAARCAEHVIKYFETESPGDDRPRKAIESAKAWAGVEIKATEAKIAAYHSNAAARNRTEAAKYAALAAGQAAAVAHVPAHELGAAAYAIRAVMAASKDDEKRMKGLEECKWQQDQLPKQIRELVLDDEVNRNDICWNVFLLGDQR